MDRKSITVVIVVLLCAAGFAYSQGWFDWSRPGTEMESSKVSADQTLDQDKARGAADKVSEKPTEPAGTATK
ncbi:MAG: hypothetical protein WD738_15400 [Pirellulales bacterium]